MEPVVGQTDKKRKIESVFEKHWPAKISDAKRQQMVNEMVELPDEQLKEGAKVAGKLVSIHGGAWQDWFLKVDFGVQQEFSAPQVLGKN
eukprot:3917180-Amphidinium_carterae.1